ncbi:MAG: histidine kinase N-terminal 7TM domain-containing protein [Bacteroidales bacterium]
MIFLISSILTGMLAVFLWFKRNEVNTYALIGLLFAIALWCFAAAFELAVYSIEAKRFFTVICYVGIVSIPVWFLGFALEYSGFIKRVPRYLKYLVWILPLASIIFLATNSSHHLFYAKSTLETIGDIAFQRVEAGVWWWVHLVYSYILITLAIVIFVRILIHSTSKQQDSAWFLIIGSGVPIILNMLYVSGVRPLGFIDFTPIGFSATGIIFFWGIYSRRLFSVKPIALKTLFNSLPDGIIMLSKELLIIDINPAVLSILSINEEKLIGVYIKDVFRDLDSAQIDTPIRLTQNDKVIDLVQSKIINETGYHVGYLIVLRDITEKKKAEKELKSVTNRFELAVAAAGFDSWENNIQTGERMGGDKIYEQLGYPSGETPKTINGMFDFVHPDDIPVVREKMQNHFDGKTDVYACDFRLKDKKGNYRWVTNVAKLVERDKDGNPLRFIGLTFDINERKRFEEKLSNKNQELVKANAEKDKFFSIIAHDLKGPFQGFIGLTQLMSESINDMSVEEMKEITQSLKVTAKNLYELLDNLLSWALIKRGHKRFNPQKVRLHTIVQNVVEVVLPQVKLKKITLKNEVDNNLNVLCDKESVNTILRNLISNAIKFTPKGGEIRILTKASGQKFIEVTVQDNGIGMPTNIQEKLFKLDKKVSRPGTDNEPSTGLGLILSKELVEKHGGKIWVESKEGEGSRFKFLIPVAS